MRGQPRPGRSPRSEGASYRASVIRAGLLGVSCPLLISSAGLVLSRGSARCAYEWRI